MDFNLNKLSLKQITLLLFLLVFGVYFYSAARTISGYGDSDEIITNSYLMSVAHPPGYPLQVLLTHLFIKLPWGGSVAFRANLFGGFCHSLTIVLFFLIFNKLLNFVKDRDKRILVSFLSSLTLAFSALYWLYSSVVEVHSLGNLIAAMTIYLAILWKEKLTSKEKFKGNKTELKYFLYVIICLGIGLGHLQTIVFIVPGLAYYFFINIIKKPDWKDIVLKRVFLAIIVLILAFVVPNLLLFYFNSRQENFSWYFDQTLIGWWKHIRRYVYKGYYVEKDVNVESAYISNFDLDKYLKAIPYYVKFLIQHFSLPGLILGILGFDFWLGKDRKKFWLFFLLFLICGPLFAMYMGIPEGGLNNLLYRSDIGIIQRQYLMGEMWFAIFIGMGILKVFNLINKKLNKNSLLSASLLILIFLGFLIKENYKMGIRRNDFFAYEFSKNILDSVEDGDVVFCSGDLSCFGLGYLQEVEGYRNKVIVLPYNAYLNKYFLDKYPEYKGFPNYNQNPEHFADIVSWNMYKGRDCYFSEIEDFYMDYIGLDGEVYFVEPKEYLFKITKKSPLEMEEYDYELSRRFLNRDFSEKNYLKFGIGDYLASHHTGKGTLYGYVNDKEQARKNFLIAREFNPEYKKAEEMLNALQNYEGNYKYLGKNESSSSAYFFQKALDNMDRNEWREAYNNIRRSLYIDPLNIDARIKKASTYKMTGQYNDAKIELENILHYFPENEEAINLLEEIERVID